MIVTHNQARAFSLMFGSGSLGTTARSVARGRRQPVPIAFLATEPALPAALTVALGWP